MAGACMVFLSELPDAVAGVPTFPSTVTRATLAGLPGGRAGTVATLRHMRALALASIRAPDQRVRLTALSLTQNLPPRKWLLEIRALHKFMRDSIRYVKDPEGVELVQTPEKTLELRAGDCDDKSTLLAALLKSIGHPARFVAVGLNGRPFSHVLVETKVARTGDDKKDWLPLETILPGKMPGWFPPGVTSRYYLKV